MPRATQTRKVVPVAGEPGVFFVESWTDPEPHRVDLFDHNGKGACSCLRFQTHTWPIIRDGLPLPYRHRCPHVNAAREYLLDHLIAEHLARQPKPPHDGA